MGLILDTVVSISRLKQDADDSQKESYVVNAGLTAVKCQLQPASPTDTAVAGGVFGQTYIGFTTESGILSGDLVTVSGTGQTYRVRGIEDWTSPDAAPHFEMTLIKFEEEELIS